MNPFDLLKTLATALACAPKVPPALPLVVPMVAATLVVKALKDRRE